MTIETPRTGDALRVGRRVELADATAADYEQFVEWLSPDGDVAALTGDVSERVTVDALHADAASGAHFCTMRGLDGERVGMVKFHRVGGAQDTTFEISGAIGSSDLWSRGYGAEGFGLVVEHLFEDLRAHRLQFWVGLFNEPMLQMVMRTRFFVLEGVLRERKFFKGEYHDVAMWSMLRHEYEALFIRGEWEGRPGQDAWFGAGSEPKAAARRTLAEYLRRGTFTALTPFER
ncbi:MULTISPECIES: GNAT family N-acetyltransferase [Streptomyces]|uniref:GNAT family N-acetyltransferase n=1 Tax=Streptomyces TaxID=1883 RepID=UPI0013D91ADD|nr:GNAT family protein [Streptomyces aureoverticillatus]QIB42020.1 GNAT family N-acetyltransferase [Streptomyces aureoverticillatus]